MTALLLLLLFVDSTIFVRSPRLSAGLFNYYITVSLLVSGQSRQKSLSFELFFFREWDGTRCKQLFLSFLLLFLSVELYLNMC